MSHLNRSGLFSVFLFEQKKTVDGIVQFYMNFGEFMAFERFSIIWFVVSTTQSIVPATTKK